MKKFFLGIGVSKSLNYFSSQAIYGTGEIVFFAGITR